MKVFKANLILSLLVLLIGVAFGSIDTFAEGTPANAPVVSLKEMPLLRGAGHLNQGRPDLFSLHRS